MWLSLRVWIKDELCACLFEKVQDQESTEAILSIAMMDHDSWGNVQFTDAEKMETNFWAERSPVHFIANGPIVS